VLLFVLRQEAIESPLSSHSIELPSIRLVGVDVDGTLIGSSGQVPAKVWQAAHHARAAGIRIVLCSGRPAFGITMAYAAELDPDGWHLFQNGASIVHLQTHRSLSTGLPSLAIEQLIQQARTSGRALELYTDTEYATESASTWARDHAALLGVRFEPRPFETLRGVVVRAQWLVPPEEVDVVMAAGPAGLEIAQSSSPLMPDTRFVGLTRAGVSKGSALRTIAEKYGISLPHVMYVGDSGNDLSALQIVGSPVAMANADPEVIAAATRVVPHVDEGGLAKAFELATRS
jgi:Cof subfamily protein (haloacid dehalogenase superfamily)